MEVNFTRAFVRNITFAMITAPLIQFVADILWFHNGFILSGTILRQISYILFIPAVLGAAYLTSSKVIGIVSSWLCLAGITGGIAIITLFRLGIGLEVGQSGLPQIVEQAFETNPAIGITIFIPGIFFPLGFVIFSVAFLKSPSKNYILSALFAITGILFWFGNALENRLAMYVGDVLMIILFFLLAKKFSAN